MIAAILALLGALVPLALAIVKLFGDQASAKPENVAAENDRTARKISDGAAGLGDDAIDHPSWLRRDLK